MTPFVVNVYRMSGSCSSVSRTTTFPETETTLRTFNPLSNVYVDGFETSPVFLTFSLKRTSACVSLVAMTNATTGGIPSPVNGDGVLLTVIPSEVTGVVGLPGLTVTV